jgi:hypothetical protein
VRRRRYESTPARLAQKRRWKNSEDGLAADRRAREKAKQTGRWASWARNLSMNRASAYWRRQLEVSE